MKQFSFSLLLLCSLLGCAAIAPTEVIQVSNLSTLPATQLKVEDARSTEEKEATTVQTFMGPGARVVDSMIDPEPKKLVAPLLAEFFESQKYQTYQTLFLRMQRFDVAVVKGRAGPIANAPGAEGYLGYAGAALGKMMVQAFADAGAANVMVVELRLHDGSNAIGCNGALSMRSLSAAQALEGALRGAIRSCGAYFLPAPKSVATDQDIPGMNFIK
jgi:hypothetical protein